MFATYGIIGLGINSPVWEEFIDSNFTAKYSIDTNLRGYESNITLGGFNQRY